MPHLDQYEEDGVAEPPDDYDPEAEMEAGALHYRQL